MGHREGRLCLLFVCSFFNCEDHTRQSTLHMSIVMVKFAGLGKPNHKWLGFIGYANAQREIL